MKIKNYKSLILSSATLILEAVILYVICLFTIKIDAMTLPLLSYCILLGTTAVLSIYVGAAKPIMLIPFAAVSFAVQTVMPGILYKSLLSWQSVVGILGAYVLLPVAAGGLIGFIIRILIKKFKKSSKNIDQT